MRATAASRVGRRLWSGGGLALLLGVATACTNLLGIEQPRRGVERPSGTDPPDASAGTPEPCPEEAPTRCGEECVNLGTDPLHCGACFHDCLGGTCDRGQCGEVTLAKNLLNIYDVAIGDEVFFTADTVSRDPFVARIPGRERVVCDGADERCILSLPDLLGAPVNGYRGPLAADARVLYVGVETLGVLERRHDTGGVRVYAETQGLRMNRLLPGGAAVFVSAVGKNLLSRLQPGVPGAPLATATEDSETVASGLTLSSDGRALFAAVDSSNVELSGLYRVDASGTAEPCRAPACRITAGTRGTLAQGGGWIFFARNARGRTGLTDVVRIRPDGRCDGRTPCPEDALTDAAIPRLGITTILADDRHLYWVRSGVDGPGAFEVRRMPVDEVCQDRADAPCGETVLGVKPSVMQLVQDATSIYAAFNDPDARIVRKAK